MTEAGGVEVRPVTAEHREALATFSCRAWAEPWTAEVEATIHCLADELELSDAMVARGLWAGDELLAVVVWRKVPLHAWCQSLVLAVQTGHQRGGYGRRLKELELDEARHAGCTVMISRVHRRNRAMMKLNESLGANFERIEGDADYALCIIAL